MLGYFLAAALVILINAATFAQEVLVGLTSAGGVSGGGTAFSIKTNGTSFTVHKAFVNIGASPEGDLVKAFDGNFYGMTSSSEGGYGTLFKMAPAGVVTILKRFDYSTTGGYPYGSLLLGKDSALYGMTNQGGSSGSGTIFRITTSGAFKVLKNLSTITGGSPYGSLVQGTDGLFYGMTSDGGTNGYGTIFKITSTGSFTLLKNLDAATTGANPHGSLVQGSDGAFYGMTNNGGTDEYGTIFKISTSGTLAVLKNLDYYTTGGFPDGSLLKASDGAFYGMTNTGGTNTYGTIFKITQGGTFSVIKNMDLTTTGIYPQGSLVQGSDGQLYGMASNGGTYNYGTIFKITTSGTATILRHLKDATDGSTPYGSLYKNSDGNFYGMTFKGGGSSTNSGTIFKIASTGTFTVLNRLPDNAQGMLPQESLVQASDGYFYGTAAEGGTYGNGALFKLCTSGSYTVLKSLTTVNGMQPKGSLMQATDGNFYGVTTVGGSNNKGTIFKLTPTGTLTVLKNLDDVSGTYPEGSLVQAADGALYGMMSTNGTNNDGTIFKITTGGTFTILKNLEANTTGSSPYGSLVQGSDGALYGMTNTGGTYGTGTIFKITTGGTLTVLKNLSGTTGNTPYGSLVKGSAGTLYGLTSEGGSYGNGTVFKITSTGTLTVLKNLDGTTTGGHPQGGLVQGSDGTLYGMTSTGGTYKGGTIFKITTGGTFTVLRHLNGATDGSAPYGSLLIQKPTPIVNAQSVTTAEDTAKVITFTASGSTPSAYAISTAPKNGTLSGTGATRTYTPKANFYGNDSFYVTATWGCQTAAPAKIRITVTSVNDAPVLAAIGNKSVAKGSTLTFTATATDVDAGQTKNFSLISAPTGASIGSTSGAFSWKPATAGTVTFKVRVTDNGSPARYDEETISVNVTTTALTTVMMNKPEGVVSEQANHFKSTLYPNPVTSQFTIAMPTAAAATITILDAKGVVMYIKTFAVSRQVQLDASGLQPGTYLLQLQTAQGTDVLKFVKL